MKVQYVEAIPISYQEPNDANSMRHLCLVKVTSTDGVVGWGEAITQFLEASLATAKIVEGMAELVVGRDPTQIESIWTSLNERCWWYGYRGGIAGYAISALDIALWDLVGKASGRRVLDLLGGSVHETLPAIASAHAFHASIGQMAEEAASWLESGLRGVKVGFGKKGDANLGYDHDRDVEFVRAFRKAIGVDRYLMIDIGYAIKWDLPTATRRVIAFEEFGIDWIEEPLGAWDPDGYRALKNSVRTPIAYGEREWDVRGYEEVLLTGTADVIGIDPGRAGGITGFRKVCDLVVAHGKQANAHAWSSAIVTAASLALSFNSPACNLFELKPIRNPMQHDLVEHPIEHLDGWMYPTTGPGLGIEIIEEQVEASRTERVLG